VCSDVSFMERALALARHSLPFAGVNPPVGAVLARNGIIIGQGFHHGPGTLHAEAEALVDARESLEQAGGTLAGSTLYCTLEPCCHSGHGKRTPPCTEAIIAAGVSRVVFASTDPNPLVSGKGAARLRQAGVAVESGLLAEQGNALIEVFSVSIRLRRPFIHIKWAQSLDGRLACKSGASRWITNSVARAQAHELRSRHDAVMVGAGTLRSDDPQLTVRDAPVSYELGSRQPLRIILAGRKPLPLGSHVFTSPPEGKTIVVAAHATEALAQCRSAGIRVVEVGCGREGLPDLSESLGALYSEGIGSVFVEGGSLLITGLLSRGFWDAVTVFTSPLILGAGVEAVGDLSVESPDLGIRFADPQFQVSDGFVRFDARNPRNCAEPSDLGMPADANEQKIVDASPGNVEGSCSRA